MKVVTKYSLCALVSMGLACATYAKQDDEREQKDKGRPDKVEAVYGMHKKDKEKKVAIVCEHPKDPSERPFSVPDAGSTAVLLGLSLGVVGLARRKWASRQLKM
jgi:protein with PEP-CTERM/exosortase system signal